MEFIVLTLGYFSLLGCMVYKGAEVPTIVGAASVYISAYLGVRRNSNQKGVKERKDNDGS